ncbi:transposase [Paractinoplanes abujensis]|uniref:transposase n=1 Tax=Paractinoplanes abujensis TaxID=882441 RepID=UPI00161B0825
MWAWPHCRGPVRSPSAPPPLPRSTPPPVRRGIAASTPTPRALAATPAPSTATVTHARADLLGFTGLPQQIRPRTWSNNPSERLHKENPPPHRRRRDPQDRDAVIRLVSAVLAEEQTGGRRHVALGVLDRVAAGSGPGGPARRPPRPNQQQLRGYRRRPPGLQAAARRRPAQLERSTDTPRPGGRRPCAYAADGCTFAQSGTDGADMYCTPRSERATPHNFHFTPERAGSGGPPGRRA